MPRSRMFGDQCVLSSYTWLLYYCHRPDLYLLQSHRARLAMLMNVFYVRSLGVWVFSGFSLWLVATVFYHENPDILYPDKSNVSWPSAFVYQGVGTMFNMGEF